MTRLTLALTLALCIAPAAADAPPVPALKPPSVSGAMPWWGKNLARGNCGPTAFMVKFWRDIENARSIRVDLDGFIGDLRWQHQADPADSKWMLYVHTRNGGSCVIRHGVGTPAWLDELGGVPA